MKRLLKWVVRIAAVSLLLVVVGLIVGRLLWEERPVSQLRSGSSEVMIFGRAETLTNSAVDGGFAVVLNNLHRVVLANGELSVNDVNHGRGFSVAHIRLRTNGSLETVVHRTFERGEPEQ